MTDHLRKNGSFSGPAGKEKKRSGGLAEDQFPGFQLLSAVFLWTNFTHTHTHTGKE